MLSPRLIPILLFICAANAAYTTTASSADAPALAPADEAAEASSGRYIIRLATNTNLRKFDTNLQRTLAEFDSAAPGENQLVHRYNAGKIKGYAGVFSSDMLQVLKNDASVVGIEEDAVGFIDVAIPSGMAPSSRSTDDTVTTIKGVRLTPHPVSWSQSRVSTRAFNRDAPFAIPAAAGDGVTVYVIDTGVDHTHPEFQSRAISLPSFVAEEPEDNDLNGHGTHVAGTCCSQRAGIAPLVNVVGVKGCDRHGRCFASDLIKALTAIMQRQAQNTSGTANPPRAVINMSLGIKGSDMLDEAVSTAVHEYGIPVIVSVGNDGENGCYKSPRRNPDAFVVAASDKGDRHAVDTFWSSNYGPCVKVYAPGMDIVSLNPRLRGPGQYLSRSGSSMATPAVTGIAALYLSQLPATQRVTAADVYKMLLDRATPNAIDEVPEETKTHSLVYTQPSDTYVPPVPTGEAAVKPPRRPVEDPMVTPIDDAASVPMSRVTRSLWPPVKEYPRLRMPSRP